MSQELKITKERVLKAAEKCSTAKDTLKELFPEAFDPDAFDFGPAHELDAANRSSRPMFIGESMAPYGLRGKCLLVHMDYDMEVTESCGHKCLIFRRKP